MDTIIHSILNAGPLVVYLLVALILLLESCAVPIANTTLLLLTGALASLGHLNIYILALTAILGSITGACLAYLLGSRGGRQVLLRLATRFRVDPQKIIVAENWFQVAVSYAFSPLPGSCIVRLNYMVCRYPVYRIPAQLYGVPVSCLSVGPLVLAAFSRFTLWRPIPFLHCVC